MTVNVHGKYQWLWNLMDTDTRFLLASQITGNRYAEDARAVFATANSRVKEKPGVIITDGLPAYREAFSKEFFTLKNPRVKHIRHIRLSGDTNNNVVERSNGTIRERDKVMRTIKRPDTPIIEGQRIYYNFIWPHKP